VERLSPYAAYSCPLQEQSGNIIAPPFSDVFLSNKFVNVFTVDCWFTFVVLSNAFVFYEKKNIVIFFKLGLFMRA
jgi:hypothetical protein